jgi:glycosyltransferase involved in cell wall biosynthesis
MADNRADGTPEVSVVVPVYNGERTIRSCIESILSSRSPVVAMELICVDNASTDGTLAELRSFGDAIRVVHAPKRGPGAARNAGLAAASGEFVAFTDADCTVAPGWLQSIVEPLRTGSPCVSGGRILARPEAGSVERFGELVHDHQKAIEVDAPPYLIGMNMACRRDRLLSIGGFDERWLRSEDVEIAYRLLMAGCVLVYCPEAVVFHRNRDTVFTLMREGFVHGQYTPAIRLAYGDFIRSYRATATVDAERARTQEIHARLRPWQIGLLWRIFHRAKRVGEFAGSRFPPVRIP